MSQMLRFHGQSQLQNLGVMTLILAVVFVAGHLFGQYTLVSTYYGIVPFIVVLLSLIVASATATSQLTVAVSMGGSRREYFWSLHLLPLVYTVYGVAITLFFRHLRPDHLGLSVIMQVGVLWVALATYVAFYLGTGMGILTVKHPLWGVAIVALCCGVGGGIVGYHSVKFIETPPMLSIAPVALVALGLILLWNVYLKKYIDRFSL